MKKITIIFLAVVALLVSCEQSRIELDNPQVAGEPIELSLGALNVEQMGAGTAEAAESDDEIIPLTKSSLSTEPSTVIKNLWVLQFSYTGNIVGTPHYFKNFDELTDAEKKVKLIPSEAEGEEGENTIVYLANTFNDQLIQFVGENYSLDDVSELSHSITDEQSNFTTDGTSDTKYMVMYGSIKQHISSGDPLESCTLSRTVAKITVTLVNNVDDLSFVIANIAGVPNKSYYFPNLTENHPADKTFHTVDYPTEEIDDTTTFTFYVPTNRRGAVNNGSQLLKNHFGSHNHTSLNVVAKADNGEIYIYTFYLGANLTNDFNIDCNKEYKYTLTFDSKGDSEYDDRVKVLTSTDFTKKTISRSNCYILNPSSIFNQKIYIPIDRIDKFWKRENGYITNGDIYVNNTLANVNNNWEAVLMWHDSEYTLDSEAQTLGGLKVEKGVSPSTGEACVAVTLPRHYQHCNVGFVVRRTDTENKDILWSWHLWITDYNPYPKSLSPSLNIWNYEVDGGELHRYNNSAFMGGIYSDKFILDRNIGASSADYDGYGDNYPNNHIEHAGSLFYQYGRKDPFPSVRTKYLNNYVCGADGDATKQQSFEYSVNNPHKFITYSGNWCKSDNSKNTNYIWNDHNIEKDGYTSGKSIFDPSPLGFRLPINDIWKGFTGGNEAEETVPNNYTFIWTHYLSPILAQYDYGRLYNGFSYYPVTGYVRSDNGVISHSGSNGHCWSASLFSEKEGYGLQFGASFLSVEYHGVRAVGMPVRPVQE